MTSAGVQLRDLRRDLDLVRVVVVHRLDLLIEGQGTQTAAIIGTFREMQARLERLEAGQRAILVILSAAGGAPPC